MHLLKLTSLINNGLLVYLKLDEQEEYIGFFQGKIVTKFTGK